MYLFSSLVYKDIQVHSHTHLHTKNGTFFKLTAIFLLITPMRSCLLNCLLYSSLKDSKLFKEFFFVFLFSVLSVMLLFPFVSASVIKIQKYNLLLHKCYIITITISNSFTILDHTRVFVISFQDTRWFYCLSCIQLYIYMTLLTYRHAQYLSSF